MQKKKKIDIIKNFKIYFGLAKPYKWLFLLTILIVALVAISELVEKLIFKELIDNGTLFTAGTITQIQFSELVFLLAIIFVIASIVKIIGNWSRFHIINQIDGNIIFDLKQKLYFHLINLSHNFHTAHRTGSLIARFTRGPKAVESLTDFFLFESTPLLFRFLAAFIPILFIDVTAAFSILIMGIVFMTYSILLMQKRQKSNVLMNEAEDYEKAHISDTFTNIETIKYFGKESTINKKFKEKSMNTKLFQIQTWNFARWLVSGHNVIIFSFLVIILYSPILRMLKGEVTIGSIVFIYTMYLNFISPLERFAWQIRNLYTGLADFQTLTQYLDIEKEVKDKQGAKNLKVKSGKIHFKNISFKYNKRKIIKNLDLEINPNEKVAIIGHSGSGKTTLVKLLYRLYNLNEGEILIDGQNVANVKQESLRNELSIVPQEGILFNDTIENNILFSNPSATKKEIKKALKQAQFYKFVNSLPDKEQTMVGERGIKLSGGEKQRLSIARAILANKKILVLDEATSALDSKTEKDIQLALTKLMHNRTSIIIAHRLSTIMHANKIIVIDKGKIKQIGTHNELIKQKGIYKELWGLQKGGYLQE